MASGLCAALTGRTHGCTDQQCDVKILLANSEPFSNRASLVKDFLLPSRVTVLSAVGRIRRNIWSEAQVLQCPQRAGMR